MRSCILARLGSNPNWNNGLDSDYAVSSSFVMMTLWPNLTPKWVCWNSQQDFLMNTLAGTTLEKWGGQKGSNAQNAKMTLPVFWVGVKFFNATNVKNNNRLQLEPFFIKVECLFKNGFGAFTLWQHLKKVRQFCIYSVSLTLSLIVQFG